MEEVPFEPLMKEIEPEMLTYSNEPYTVVTWDGGFADTFGAFVGTATNYFKNFSRIELFRISITAEGTGTCTIANGDLLTDGDGQPLAKISGNNSLIIDFEEKNFVWNTTDQTPALRGRCLWYYYQCDAGLTGSFIMYFKAYN